MTEKEYQEALKVRSQLSYLDRLRIVEYELAKIRLEMSEVNKRIDALLTVNSNIEELEKRLMPESTAGFLDQGFLDHSL